MCSFRVLVSGSQECNGVVSPDVRTWTPPCPQDPKASETRALSHRLLQVGVCCLAGARAAVLALGVLPMSCSLCLPWLV